MKLTFLAGGIAAIMPLLLIAGSAAADIGLSLIALLFLLYSAIRKNWGWLKHGWMLCALAIWGYLNLRNLLVDDMMLSLKRSLPWIRYPLFAAALGTWLLKEEPTRRWLWNALMLAVAFLTADGLWQYYSGADILGNPPIMEAGYPRLTGPFGDPMLGIMLVWISFPIIATAWKEYRLLPIIVALAVIATVFLSGERMAFLLLLFGMVILLFTAGQKIRLMLVAATALLGAVLFTTAPQTVNRQVGSVMESAQHIEHSPYGMIWQSTFNIVKESPLIGIGSNQFRNICPNEAYGEAPAAMRCNQHPHQLYLEWLVDGGIIGLALFLSLAIALIRLIWRSWPYWVGHPIFIGLVITVTLRLWPLATSSSFFTSWVAAPFWLMLGWLLSYCYRARNE